MSVQRSLRSLPRVNYAALHTGSEFTPEKAILYEAGESVINGTSAHKDSLASVDGLADASPVDALTLEAQALRQEINQAKLARQQREKEQEVLQLRNKLAELQRDQLDQKVVRPHLANKKPHVSSLVVDNHCKMASLTKKVDRKLSALGLKDDGQASSSEDDDQLSSEDEDSEVVRKQRGKHEKHLKSGKPLKLLRAFVTLKFGLTANFVCYMSVRIFHT